MRADPDPAASAEDPPAQGVKAWLQAQPHEELVELALRQAGEHDDLWLDLELSAAAETGDAAQLRAAIEDAVDIEDFIPWREAWGYARGIERVIDRLRELLERGRATDVIALCEHLLARLVRAVGHVDDSDGFLSQLFDDVRTLHLRACRAAPPDPDQLAAKLLTWALEWDPLDGFLDALPDYADVLGRSGVAAYRRAAELRFALLPPITPGPQRRWDGDASRSPA